MQCRRVADRGNPEEADLALLAQALERRHDVIEHLPDAQRRSAARERNRIVQVKDIDAVELQSREAAFERGRDRLGDAAECVGGNTDLGADDRIGRLQLLQDAAKVLFRLAVAVQHGRIEIVHADVDRARDETLLVGGIAAHHDAAHRAASKTERRDLHPRAPKVPHLHRCSSGHGRLRATAPAPRQHRSRKVEAIACRPLPETRSSSRCRSSRSGPPSGSRRAN